MKRMSDDYFSLPRFNKISLYKISKLKTSYLKFLKKHKFPICRVQTFTQQCK